VADKLTQLALLCVVVVLNMVFSVWPEAGCHLTLYQAKQLQTLLGMISRQNINWFQHWAILVYHKDSNLFRRATLTQLGTYMIYG
jgi:hypothetical protein